MINVTRLTFSKVLGCMACTHNACTQKCGFVKFRRRLFEVAPRREFFLEGMYTFWGGPPSPPPPSLNPPSGAPTWTKRVPICSLFKQTFTCILINTWNWSVAELWGKNRDTDAHAHVIYQSPITGLHSPTLLSFLQDSTDYLMLAQSCKFGVSCCFIGLTHPAACTRARVPLTFGHVHRPPL